MTAAAYQNIRNKYGDDHCLQAYAVFLRYARKAKSHVGTITSGTPISNAGSMIARERGLTDEQVLTGR